MPISTFLNGGTAAQLRGLLYLSLSDTGKVGTRATTTDAGGGATTIWSFGSSIPCRIDPIASSGENEDVIATRLSDRSQYVITVPAGTVVTSNNRFSVTNRGTFEVTAVRTRTAQWATFFEAVAVS